MDPSAEQEIKKQLDHISKHLGLKSIGKTGDFINDMTAHELLRSHHFENFPESLQHVIDTISVRTGAEPVGSSKYVACAFPGDIDCEETLIYEGRKQRSAEAFAERLKEMMARVQLKQSFFLADFKAGFDPRIRHLLSFLNAGQASHKGVPQSWDKDGLLAELQAKKDSDEIDASLCDKIRALALATPSEPSDSAGKDSWIDLQFAIQSNMKVRWGLRKEIAAGRKLLHGGLEKSLVEAVSEGTMVKVDVWAPFTDAGGYYKYTEVTNVFSVAHLDPDAPKGLSFLTSFRALPSEESTDFCDHDVRHYGAPGPHQNFVKVLKRIWKKVEILLSRPSTLGTPLEESCMKALREIYRFYKGPVSALTQVHDESEVVRSIITRFMVNDSGVPELVRAQVMGTLLAQIMGFKKRIKTMLANEAMPFSMYESGEIAGLDGMVAAGEAVLVDGFPRDLDDLIQPIWDHPSIASWVSRNHFHEPIDCSPALIALIDSNLRQVEERLRVACNEAARRWVVAHGEQGDFHLLSEDIMGLAKA